MQDQKYILAAEKVIAIMDRETNSFPDKGEDYSKLVKNLAEVIQVLHEIA